MQNTLFLPKLQKKETLRIKSWSYYNSMIKSRNHNRDQKLLKRALARENIPKMQL